MIRIFISICFVLISIFVIAQHQGYVDHIHEIAEAESGKYMADKHSGPKTGGNFDVVYSRFYWEIDPAVLFIKGSVTTYFKPKTDQLTEVEFELNNTMLIDSIIFRNEKVSWEYFSNFQFRIELGETLTQNQLDSVAIFYQGVPEQENGFGSFAIGQHNEVPVMWTLSEPYGARDWWPGKNDLSDKIDSLDVFVKTHAAYRAASLGLLESEVVEGDFRICHWKHRYPVVSYLVAVAVTNYVGFVQYAVVGGDSIPIVNYVYPEDSAQAASDSQNTAEMIQLFDSLFGTYPFALEKYGHAQWSRGGGMEHQTMSFMQGFGHDLRAHELAHSWFGNKVTLGTWQDIFLNEGFATYLTGLSFEHMYNGFYWDIWKRNTRLAASDGPAGSVHVADTMDVMRLFSSRLSYNKGAYLLHMLRWVVGDDVFFTAVRNYVNDPMLEYRFATIDDLIWHLESVYGGDLDWFFEQWYYGEGFPTYGVNIAQSENDGGINITLFQEQSHPSVEFFRMPVPIEIYGNGLSTTLICEPTFSGESFQFPDPGFEMDSARFDPDQWLLARLDFMNVGIDEIDDSSMIIRPNPAGKFIRISIPNQKIGDVQIIDFRGRVLIEETFDMVNQEILIDISNLPVGLYLVNIKTGTSEYHGKFVKK
jgi:aminopeptidase N